MAKNNTQYDMDRVQLLHVKNLKGLNLKKGLLGVRIREDKPEGVVYKDIPIETIRNNDILRHKFNLFTEIHSIRSTWLYRIKGEFITKAELDGKYKVDCNVTEEDLQWLVYILDQENGGVQ